MFIDIAQTNITPFTLVFITTGYTCICFGITVSECCHLVTSSLNLKGSATIKDLFLTNW